MNCTFIHVYSNSDNIGLISTTFKNLSDTNVQMDVFSNQNDGVKFTSTEKNFFQNQDSNLWPFLPHN